MNVTGTIDCQYPVTFDEYLGVCLIRDGWASLEWLPVATLS